MSGLVDGCAFLPGDPRPKILDWFHETATITVEKIISIVVKRVEACIQRAPELRNPLGLMLREIYADARPT